MSKIMIAADLVPTNSNSQLFTEGDIEQLLGGALCNLLKEFDFIAMNLETPICDQLNPISKVGPCLSAPCSTINGIKKINPFFFTLANNHIMDQGKQGLIKTISLLESNGISYAGAGFSLKEAAKPFITEVSGKKVGFYCCAEHEFSIGAINLPGANPYDPLESFEHVMDLKTRTDYVVVLYHGGKEHYRYPSPRLQKIFRKFADYGANLIVAQHSHCIGCRENYHGAVLVYGQGNFIFDFSNSDYWKTSLAIIVDFSNVIPQISFLPIKKQNSLIRLAENEEADSIISEFESRSSNIQKEGFVETNYREFALSMENDYLQRLYGRKSNNLFVRILNKLSNNYYIRSLYPEKSRLAIRNILECEAHNELAIEVMRLKPK